MVKTNTIVRTCILILALTNQILSATGHSMIPVTDEQVNELITLALTVGASIWAWWKNNSFTKEAIACDEKLKQLKNR